MSIKTFDLVGTIHGREYTEFGEYVSAVDYRELERDNESLRKDAERYRLMRKITLDNIDDTQDEFDAEFDRQINRSPENPS